MAKRLIGVAVTAFLAFAASGSTPHLQLARAPLLFQPNQGQSGDHVRYLSPGINGILWITETEIVFANQRGDLSMRFDGARKLRFKPLEPHEHHTDYYRGSDRKNWVLDVPSFARLQATDVYPGINLELYGTADGALEYDFIVGPAGNPATIRLSFEGADSIRLSSAGELILEGPAGRRIHRAPFAYQIVAGRKLRVEAAFRLGKHDRVGILVGDYDHALPLVIDPQAGGLISEGGPGSDSGNAATTVTGADGETEVLIGITGRGVRGTPSDNSSDGYLFSYRVTAVDRIKIEPTQTMVIDVDAGFFRWNKFSTDGPNVAAIALTNAPDVPLVNQINIYPENDKPPFGGSDIVVMKWHWVPGRIELTFSDYFGGDSAETAGDILILDDAIFTTYNSGRGDDTTSTFLAIEGLVNGTQVTTKSWPAFGSVQPPQLLVAPDGKLWFGRNEATTDQINAWLHEVGGPGAVSQPIDPARLQLTGELTDAVSILPDDAGTVLAWLMMGLIGEDPPLPIRVLAKTGAPPDEQCVHAVPC